MALRRHTYVAVPAMDELDYLPGLLDCLRSQDVDDFSLLVCVNQPDAWWDTTDKAAVCENNQKTLELLGREHHLDMQVIDKSSHGNGWKGKAQGVGWARRVLMDRISEQASPHDLIVSMDADTTFNPGYLRSVRATMDSHPKSVALSVPYYHRLTSNAAKDRAILRYEIFMRYYALNLWRIGSPYAFTAIGSAIVVPVGAYRAIGGITPHKSGEDFYFLQKLRKFGPVNTWNTEKVYPAARYSDRVGFGTGPAMIRGSRGDWSSYPVYPAEYFDEIGETYRLFPQLYDQPVETPIDNFLQEKFGDADIWQPLRTNAPAVDQFVRSCYNRLDAFRTLQFLKWRSGGEKRTDEQNLQQWATRFQNQYEPLVSLLTPDFSFHSSEVALLSNVRDELVTFEDRIQKRQQCPQPGTYDKLT